VDADAGWVWMDGAVGEVVDVEVLAGALRVAAARLLYVRLVGRARVTEHQPSVIGWTPPRDGMFANI
jgi:hypothetical protein